MKIKVERKNIYLSCLFSLCIPCLRSQQVLLMLLLLLLLSRFSRVQLCATPETAAHQAPPSLGFSRQEHWSGLPFPLLMLPLCNLKMCIYMYVDNHFYFYHPGLCQHHFYFNYLLIGLFVFPPSFIQCILSQYSLWLTEKEPKARKDWRQEEKGMTEDEMVGWHHWLNGHEFEQTLGDGQGSLACWSPWAHKKSDKTWWLNNNSQ